jgi:hypothetical protein
MAIWYILLEFWYIFPVLVFCTKRNLATLIGKQSRIRLRAFSNVRDPAIGCIFSVGTLLISTIRALAMMQ